MRNVTLRLAVLVSALGALAPALAADPGYPPHRERHVVREVIVTPTTLVPDCHERFNAELLRCPPREAVREEDSYAVTLHRRSMLTYPRKPYPQLFSWDYP